MSRRKISCRMVNACPRKRGEDVTLFVNKENDRSINEGEVPQNRPEIVVKKNAGGTSLRRGEENLKRSRKEGSGRKVSIFAPSVERMLKRGNPPLLIMKRETRIREEGRQKKRKLSPGSTELEPRMIKKSDDLA